MADGEVSILERTDDNGISILVDSRKRKNLPHDVGKGRSFIKMSNEKRVMSHDNTDC